MALDNVIFPDPFKLANRNPLGLEPVKQRASIASFQVAVYESAKRAYDKLRPTVIPAGTSFMRSVGSQYGQTGEQACTIPPNASGNTGVRWSRLIEGTTIRRGALYTSIDAKGLLNEAVRYSRKKVERSVPWAGSPSGEAKYTVFGPATRDYEKLLVSRVYHAFKLRHSITVFDLTPSVASQFYQAIESDREYQAAKRDLRVQPELWKIAFDPVDYTASRPLGLSVLPSARGQGMQVESAQNEVSEMEGRATNVVLGGNDNQQISYLEPVGKLIAGTSDGRPALLDVKLDHGTADRSVVVPGSVLPTT